MQTRNSYELKLMRESGRISAHALKKALQAAKVGVNLLEVERVAMEEILRLGGKPSFVTVGDYKWATCLTVNDQLVHGIPHDYELKEGDLLSIDVGAIYKGWHTDCAWSIVVGKSAESAQSAKSAESASESVIEKQEVGGVILVSEAHPESSKVGNKKADSGQARMTDNEEKKKFLAVGEEALWKGIKEAVAGKYIGDIGGVIQEVVEGAGFDVSRSLIGHGVGREVHEKPDVPGFGKKGTGLKLENGATIAIEVIYAKGKAEVFLEDDGWTYTTKDHSWGGLFEMSVIVQNGQAEVLTDWRKV